MTRPVRLTRRDALVAIAASGTLGAAGALLAEERRSGSDGTPFAGGRQSDAGGAGWPGGRADGPAPVTLDAHERATAVAVARVVYPSAVTGVEVFVHDYLDGRTEGRPDAVAAIAAAVAVLDDLGREWHGGRAVDLDPGTRERLLREVGADTAEADPGGTPADRVRYGLVNELLFALYATPTGGALVGLENPPGYPGGLASYRRGPSR